jgi:predicted DNA-binding protein (MmcQ/YjbR family)
MPSASASLTQRMWCNGAGPMSGRSAARFFAIGGWQTEANAFAVVFKVSAMGWEILRDTPGCRPAPYLASRGMQWIQRVTDEGLDDAGLKDYIVDSYRIVGSGLTKKLQRELGLIGPDR